MKKPKYPYRIAILMAMLTIPPIGATQLGWYLYDMQTGFDYGMIVGTFSVLQQVLAQIEATLSRAELQKVIEKTNKS